MAISRSNVGPATLPGVPQRDVNAETMTWLSELLELHRSLPRGDASVLLRVPPHRFKRTAILAYAAPGMLPAGVAVVEVNGLPAQRVRLSVEVLGEVVLTRATAEAEASKRRAPRTPFGQLAAALRELGDVAP